MSLIVGSYGAVEWFDDPVNTTDPRAAIILTFISGFIVLAMGIFKLGFLVNYVSHAVICGFTCAASIIIAFSQMKKLLGLKNIGRHFYEAIIDVPRNLKHTKWQDLVIGLVCMVVLKSLELIKRNYTSPIESDSKIKAALRKTLWFVCTARNAVIIGIALGIGAGVDPNVTHQPFTLTGELKPGLPKPMLPEFSGDYWVPEDVKIALETVPEAGHHRKRREEATNDPASDISALNGTEEEKEYERCGPEVEGCVLMHVPASMMIGKLMSGIFIVAIMGYVESIAIAKAFARKNNYKIDPGQELYAIGVASVFASFFHSYPITGSFSRTAVNAASGVQTPAGGIVTGAIVLIATQYLTPIFKYVPSAALASVIMLSAISMFDTDGVKHAYHVNKMDLVPLFVTFLVCFYEIAIGIAAGLFVSIAIVLYPHARPKLEKDNVDGGKGCIIKLDRGFDFPGAEYLEDTLIAAATYGGYKWMVCDLSKISHLDLGAVDAIHTASQQCIRKNVCLRIVLPQEDLHKKLIAGGVERETISLTLGSALVQVGKQTGTMDNDTRRRSRTSESEGKAVLNNTNEQSQV